MAGLLAEAVPDPICDRVIIRNISVHGARVISERPWGVHQRVQLAEPVAPQNLDAQVIYCAPLADGQYAVGLRFESPIRERP